MISRAASIFAATLVIGSAPHVAPYAFAQPVSAPNAATEAAPAPAPISAVAYVVMDLDSGRILDARNPDKRMFPASTTKTMTCLVATEKGKLTDVLRASTQAAATGESGIGLLAGENHTLADLLRAAMIRSANDACVDIAEGVGGTQPKFIAMMNARAQELGAKNTHFVNPHGLHDPDHYTTARDLALIGQELTRVDFINRIAREKTAEIDGNWKIGAKRLILNRNKLLWRWEACDGLKTGYTRQAGNCLVATATLPDPTTGKPWRLLAVTMKSTPGSSFSDGERLLKNAFQKYRPQQVGTDGSLMWRGQIKGGAFPLEAVTVGQARLPLGSGEESSLSERLEMRDLEAPIEKGARVGDAVFWANGKPIVRLPLVAASDVPQTLLTKAVPAVGKRVSLWAPWKRWGSLFLLSLGTLLTAFFLAARRRRAIRARRRRQRGVPTFERADLPPASASTPRPTARGNARPVARRPPDAPDRRPPAPPQNRRG